MISARQIMFMIFLSRVSAMVVFLPVVTVGDARQDAWIAALVATVAGLLVVGLFLVLSQRFPQYTFGEICRRVLGRFAGPPAAATVALLLLAVGIFRARQLAMLLHTTTLPKTPISVLAGAVIVAGLYGAYLGADALGRVGEILVTLNFASILFGHVLLLFTGALDFGFVFPVLDRGWVPVLWGAINPAFWFVTSGAAVLVLTRYCHEPRRVPAATVTAIVVSGLLLSLTALLAVATLGPQEAQSQLSPVLSLTKIVYFMGSIERLDLLLLNVWMTGITFDVALYLLLAATVIRDNLRLRREWVVVGTGVLAFIPAVSGRLSLFELRRAVDTPVTGVAALVYVAVAGLVLAIAVIRGMKSGDRGVGGGEKRVARVRRSRPRT